MANFSTSELNQLVQDGIKTVEFIQQAAKNPKETYGRSAIQKPRTKDRIKAWEGVTADHDYTGDKQDGMPGKEKGTKKRKGKGSPKDNRGVGDEEDSIKREPSTPSEASDIQDRDVKNTTDERAEDRGDTSSGLHQPGESSDPGSDGDTESARSLGDDSVSNADYRVILSADHESSAAETTDLPSNVTNVRPATTEDFAQIFEEGSSKAHRRLTGIAAYTDSDAAHKSAENPVKKGIDGSIASTPSVDIQSSGNGAIPSVHELLLRQPSSHAHAESAHKGVPSVSTTGSTYKSCETASHHQILEGKIDILIGNVDRIASKLDLLPEIKEEIKNINKKITTLSLGLSTVENYIKSMMIIIPGSGKDEEKKSADVNPDLRPVIGRDNTRGLKEMKMERGTLEDLNDESNLQSKIDPKYLINPLDFNRSNAANFKPANDLASLKTIVAMIKNEVKDITTQMTLIEWVEKKIDQLPAEEVYNMVRESLDGMDSDES
nr:phosphoprotein [Pohorje myodes paramyxovirus 1]